MTSFDVSSLFLSIPVDIALMKLDEHLNKCDIEKNNHASQNKMMNAQIPKQSVNLFSHTILKFTSQYVI